MLFHLVSSCFILFQGRVHISEKTKGCLQDNWDFEEGFGSKREPGKKRCLNKIGSDVTQQGSLQQGRRGQ